jgi:hypothetical protein
VSGGSAPSAPPPPPPPPLKSDAEIQAETAKARAIQAKRMGRAATILTGQRANAETLGSPGSGQGMQNTMLGGT